MGTADFRFKQFTVRHDRCGMKTGTDGVLLGAWTSCPQHGRALDVGTGSGLIAMMLAQRCQAHIVAVEIDRESFEQAAENVAACRWSNRIDVYHVDFQSFVSRDAGFFDLVVCNPPFFQNSLKSSGNGRTMARHNDSLPFEELIEGVSRLLTPRGRFSVVLPAEAERDFRELAVYHNLFPARITHLRTRPHKPPKRVLIEFSYTEAVCIPDTLCITDETGAITSACRDLTAPFYLAL